MEISNFLQKFNDAHSSKKIAAWFSILFTAYTSYRFADDRTIVSIVLIWLGFASLCFGLTNITELAKLKNNSQSEINDTTIINNADQSNK